MLAIASGLEGRVQEPGVLLERLDLLRQQVDRVVVLALQRDLARLPRADEPRSDALGQEPHVLEVPRQLLRVVGQARVLRGVAHGADRERAERQMRSASSSFCAAGSVANVSNSGCSAAKCGPLMFQCAILICECRSMPSVSTARSDSQIFLRSSGGSWLGVFFMVLSFVMSVSLLPNRAVATSRARGVARCRARSPSVWHRR